MWAYFNNNPLGKRVGDCSVRAVSKALGISWKQAYSLMSANGFRMGDMPSSDAVWGNVLQQNGFKRQVIPNSCPDCYTARDFCLDHKKGIYVLAFGGHVATSKDGTLFDSWDSSNEVPIYVWKEI